ncbi:MAG TPA: SPOR domain-containing protein, partial [Terriglobales bacterium]
KNSVGPQVQMTDAPATLPAGMTPGAKPGAGMVTPAVAEPAADTAAPASTSAPASDTPEPAAPPTAAPTSSTPQLVSAKQTEAAHALPAIGAGIVVQVAAVKNRGDADILMNALRQKGYPVFLANGGASADNFYRVQVGPFANVSDAEITKTKLAGDGYSPIIKR